MFSLGKKFRILASLDYDKAWEVEELRGLTFEDFHITTVRAANYSKALEKACNEVIDNIKGRKEYQDLAITLEDFTFRNVTSSDLADIYIVNDALDKLKATFSTAENYKYIRKFTSTQEYRLRKCLEELPDSDILVICREVLCCAFDLIRDSSSFALDLHNLHSYEDNKKYCNFLFTIGDRLRKFPSLTTSNISRGEVIRNLILYNKEVYSLQYLTSRYYGRYMLEYILANYGVKEENLLETI